jgi:hypothetical protein
MIYEKDLFEYRNGEPPENYLTVLRALDVRRPLISLLVALFDPLLDFGPLCATHSHKPSTYREPGACTHSS